MLLYKNDNVAYFSFRDQKNILAFVSLWFNVINDGLCVCFGFHIISSVLSKNILPSYKIWYYKHSRRGGGGSGAADLPPDG